MKNPHTAQGPDKICHSTDVPPVSPARSHRAVAVGGETANAFIQVAPLYDHLMHGVPYDDWIDYLHRLLKERNANPRTILDLACGTGNVSERLAHQGYQVTGVDIASGMITQARQKAEANGLNIPYHIQDAADLDLPGSRFDLCISLFDSLNYVIEPQRLASVFDRVAAHLTPNGLFIFDLNSELALMHRFFDQNNLGVDDPLHYHWASEYFPDTRLCRVQMSFLYRGEDGTQEAFDEVHWQYAYREDEICELLRDSGFDRIAVYKAYTLRAPTPQSDRLFYVARRP